MALLHLYSLILPLCALLVAGGFVACWRWKPQQRDLLWMAGCFALFGVGVASQILAIPAALDTNAVLSAALYHGAVWCQAEAMTARFRVPMHRAWAALVAAAALAALSYYAYADDQLYVRVYLLNFGLAMQLALSTFLIWRARAPLRLERLLRWLFAVFVLSFVVRTVLTMPEREGLTFASFSFTTFWVVLQLSLLVFAMLFAMLYLAIAVQQAWLQLQDERNRDPLTQLLNRRAFYEAVEQPPHTVPLGAVLLCDVDHFKRINDRWGHAAGDAVLQRIAQLLQSHVRDSDVVARYGGEEFIVLLRGLPLAAAAQRAEHLRQHIAMLAHPNLPGQTRVTVSIGVAAVQHPAQLQPAIAQADALLYEAKAGGRNGVRWQGAPAPLPSTVELARRRRALRVPTPPADPAGVGTAPPNSAPATPDAIALAAASLQAAAQRARAATEQP